MGEVYRCACATNKTARLFWCCQELFQGAQRPQHTVPMRWLARAVGSCRARVCKWQGSFFVSVQPSQRLAARLCAIDTPVMTMCVVPDLLVLAL